MIRWNVRRLATQQGITAAQLAKRAGISWPTATRLFRRRQPPVLRIETPVLEAVARALGVRPWDLLEYRD